MTIAAAPSHDSQREAPPLSLGISALILTVWLLISTALCVSGVFGFDRPYLIPLLLFGTTASLVAAYHLSPALRARLAQTDLRLFVGFHIIRAPIGAWFLVLASRGQLPELFAFRGGWGDILAGVLALMVLPLMPPRGAQWKKRAVWVWNLVGLLDILMVVGTAQYLFLIVRDPLMLTLASLPFGLLPTFIVPIVIATHILIFARLRA